MKFTEEIQENLLFLYVERKQYHDERTEAAMYTLCTMKCKLSSSIMMMNDVEPRHHWESNDCD